MWAAGRIWTHSHNIPAVCSGIRDNIKKEESALHTISNSVVKKDHAPKMEGRSVYVCDIDKHGVLCGKMLRSKYARAKLLSVKVPELPDGYYYVDRNDVPGDNNVNIVMDDTPV